MPKEKNQVQKTRMLLLFKCVTTDRQDEKEFSAIKFGKIKIKMANTIEVI